MVWQIGVDVGGTFTDLLALDPEGGTFRVAKVPSPPEDQSVGFMAGLSMLETGLAAVAALVHGTTVATNAVLERKGARCGLITTAGFRDVLELGRRTRLAEAGFFPGIILYFTYWFPSRHHARIVSAF